MPVYGDGYITDLLCGVKVRIGALSFYQVNRTMAERLYGIAAEFAEPSGKTVLDLYCGAGTIGLSMAKAAKEIVGAEIVPQAVEAAKFNAAANGINNARFICADAYEAARRFEREGIRPERDLRKACRALSPRTFTPSEWYMSPAIPPLSRATVPNLSSRVIAYAAPCRSICFHAPITSRR